MKKTSLRRTICMALVILMILVTIIPTTVYAETVIDELTADLDNFVQEMAEANSEGEYTNAFIFIMLLILGIPALVGNMSKKS